ncbi:MAG: DUF4870 domain-containing protein [Ignavibacterium sp.]
MEENTFSNEMNLSKDDRTWGMISHISALLGYVIPLGNIIAPLIIWLSKKEQSNFIEDQSKEALNFQISIVIYAIIAGILSLILIGIFLLIAVGLFNLIYIIIAAIKANDGIKYRYPLCIRIIK